jgi:hypothetical protein
VEMPLRSSISTVLIYQADPVNRGSKIKQYLPVPIFVMGTSCVGVPCRDSHGSGDILPQILNRRFGAVTTKASITPGLRHDLLSVKALHSQGYQVI